MDVLVDKVVGARKEYHCDACRVFNNAGLGACDVDTEDWLLWTQAELEGFRIQKGQKYRKCVYRDGGELITYRGRPEIDRICQKYDLYED